MNDTIYYEGQKVTIIVNQKLKHTYLSVSRDGIITVKTAASQKFVREFLAEKKVWLHKQLHKIDSLQRVEENILHSEEIIEQRTIAFSKVMKLSFSKLKFRKMKSRWGSCNSRREITLNRVLQRIPLELLDYVIVHELAHLKHMNHSKEFHALVETHLPNSKEYRKALKNIYIT